MAVGLALVHTSACSRHGSHAAPGEREADAAAAEPGAGSSSAQATSAGSSGVAPSASAVAGELSAPPPDGMRLVPGGTFTMGADNGGEEDEHPAHAVTLASFFLDVTEVTNEAYARCVAAGACRPHDAASAAANHFGPDASFRAPRQPISSIGWDDAAAYCRFAGKRLPREAEWERAARGDDARPFPWGSEPASAERAVFGWGVTAEVGSKPAGAGPYGHLDLAGNVWEWVADDYDPYAYRRPTAASGVPGTCPEILAAQDELRRLGKQGFTGTNPIPTTCEHVLRGGAFNYPPPGLRTTNRVHHSADMRLIMAGVRCARDAP